MHFHTFFISFKMAPFRARRTSIAPKQKMSRTELLELVRQSSLSKELLGEDEDISKYIYGSASLAGTYCIYEV